VDPAEWLGLGQPSYHRDVMKELGNESSPLEKGVGFAVLLCLAAIATGVFLRQFSFNPAVLVARNAEPQKAPGPLPPPLPRAWLPPELVEFSAPESFTPENLYDKIDGKAELYLSAGFVRLNCQRFALKEAPDQWLEWFVYDMGALPQAFSVFTVQRRAEGQPLDLTEYAYRTQNALYFVCGSNYIEAVASAPSEPLMKAMLALAGRFVAANPPSASPLPQLALFPSEGLVPGSYTLQSSDAFGFDRFKNVFTAQYRLNQAEVTAFLTSCASADAAAALRDAYRSFLIENGGKEAASTGSGDLGKAIEIMGGLEIVFSEGSFVAGVHSAPDFASGETVASRLRQRLVQKPK
jgi:hypothetical protein